MTVPKVVHLSSVHPAFDTRIFWKECRSLALLGYDTHLVVPHPRTEIVENVTIHGIPRPTNRRDRIAAGARRIYDTARDLDADVYHFHDPDLLPIGALLRKRTGAKVIYDSHEHIGLQLRDRTWIPKPLRPAVAVTATFGERRFADMVDFVISAEPGGLERFPSDRRALVRNLPLLSEFDGGQAHRDPVVTYVGAITRARGAAQMVDAIGLVEPDIHPHLALAGVIGERGLEDELRASPGFANTELMGRIERPAVAELLGRAAIGLATLQPTDQYTQATQPVKLFEYLASGIAVVASDFPSWRDLLGPDAPVRYVDPTDPKAIAAAITELTADPAGARQMGEAGRRLVTSRFSWETEQSTLAAVYEQLVGAPVPVT